MLILANTFWPWLEKLDRGLFERVNSRWTNPFFDQLMPFLRESAHWAPLYLFVAVFMVLNFRKRAFWWIMLFLVTVALTDMTGTYLLKHQVGRLRPCSDPDMALQVRLLLDHCSCGYSFISNHAANHFGMAVFFMITLRNYIGRWKWLALCWAASIAYAQVYVGVHFPLDVLAGALLGTGAGFVTGSLFNKRFGFAIFDNQPKV